MKIEQYMFASDIKTGPPMRSSYHFQQKEQLEIFKLDDNDEQIIPPGHPDDIYTVRKYRGPLNSA